MSGLLGHTPGSWAAERCEHTPCWHIEAGAYPLGSHICEVGEKPREGNAEANARLIAAAPDLLEALRSLVGEEMPSRHDFDAARAVLAELERQP